jgi:BMFP domain-containing protein YqiC
MTLRERLRPLVLDALQHPRLTSVIASPTAVRLTMAAVAVQARIDALEARWTRAIARAFNLPTREEAFAWKATIQRLEARLQAFDSQQDR